jgi:tocopherol O-methyltransferase
MNSDLPALESAIQQEDFEPFQTQAKLAPARNISADAVRQHYEIMSLPYLLFWGEHLHHGLFSTGRESPRQAQVQLLEYCSRLLKIQPGARVLDVGCGYGGTALYLARNFRCRVDGLTLSPKQARIARTKIARACLGDLASIEVCDVEQDAEPFNTRAQYDVIWTMESSEHLQDKAGYIERAARLLHHRGQFIIAAWTRSKAAPLVRTAPLVEKIAELTVCPGFQTAGDYARQLCRAGLGITSITDLTESVLPTWEICYRRVTRARLLWQLMPAEIRTFLGAIPLMIEAYRRGLMSYTVIVAAPDSHTRSSRQPTGSTGLSMRVPGAPHIA